MEARKVEGCSYRTIHYYQTTVEKMLTSVTTIDLLYYGCWLEMVQYHTIRHLRKSDL